MCYILLCSGQKHILTVTIIIGINIWHISFFITCWTPPPPNQNLGNDEAEVSSSTAVRTSNFASWWFFYRTAGRMVFHVALWCRNCSDCIWVNRQTDKSAETNSLMAFKVISHRCYLPFAKHASCEVTSSNKHAYVLSIVAYCSPQCVMWYEVLLKFAAQPHRWQHPTARLPGRLVYNS
jgi:hypothetical protein